MERGSAKHSPRQDDALSETLAGQLGPGGSNREEWADPEPPADDDPPTRTDPSPGGTSVPDIGTAADIGAADEPANQDDAEMHRIQQDAAIANDWNPAADEGQHY
jgi:hypothetical protein